MNTKMKKDWRKRSDQGYFVSASKVFKPILKDYSVKKWIAKLREKAGWRSTLPGFLRTLYKFSEYCGKSPSELVALALGKTTEEHLEETVPASSNVQEIAQKFVDEMLNSGKRESARYARACLASFFRANGVSLHLVRISKFTKKSEVIPTKEQVYLMVDHARSLRDRAIILCMYQSGLGVTLLRNLNYGHVKEQTDKNRVPIRVPITSEIAKKTLPATYHIFLGMEACEALRNYLNERKRRIKRIREQGGKAKRLASRSPLFASEGKNVPFGGRMAISSIWRIIKNSAEKAGLKKESVWPTSLRKAFEVELDRLPLDQDTKQFLLGHYVPNAKYDIDRIEKKYLMCNFSRTELDRLAVIKDFVRSLGIERLETKMKRVRAQSPQITEEDALRFLVRSELEQSKVKSKARGINQERRQL